MENITKSLLVSNIITLLFFGIVYSVLLSSYLGAYPGFIFILMTFGFVLTIYIIGKESDTKVIKYVWISIIVLAEVALILILILR